MAGLLHVEDLIGDKELLSTVQDQNLRNVCRYSSFVRYKIHFPLATPHGR